MRTQLKLAIEEDRNQKEDKKPGFMDHVSSAAATVGSVAADVTSGLAEGLGLADLDGEAAVQEIEQQASENDTTGAVLESLGLYALEMEQLLATKTCTPLTNSLVVMGVQQQLNHLGMSLEGIALEANADANEQGQLVLESLRNAWNRIKQGFIVAVQDNVEEWDDFEVIEKALGTNVGRLQATEREFKAKKFTDPEHDGSMVAIWKFFSDTKGPRTDLVAAAREDVKLTQFIFGKLLSDLQAQTTALAGILSGAKMATAEQAAAVAAKVEKLKHPLELWDMKLVNKESGWLNGVKLTVKKGSERNALTVAGKQYPRLAQLATPGYVDESSTAWQTVREITVGNGVVGGSVHAATASSIKYKTSDITDLIKAGYAYGDALKQMLKGAAAEEKALAKLKESLKRLGGEEMSRESELVLTQIQQYFDNLMKAGRAVIWRERMRGLQAMRFCGYAAERMITNAK